ncbi:hypothetical protein ACFSPU_10270 [Haoranjiania flava]|uniref:Uncharacterized protein n=1 Tax=Haoranjiania flava TaxID=1856322 RepID=A0AAE3IQP1_9BACT|nr:hypothetical protein [Haoranjiania flava]MCU7695406.1 hypothetical protein [Haoranjiania flava]
MHSIKSFPNEEKYIISDHCFFTLQYSFAQSTENIIDKKLVGSWKGYEKDNQVVGMEKYWIQHRFEDGSFIILFTAIADCEVMTTVEKGKWWVKDGLFYELHLNSNKTDIYSYELLNDATQVKFKAKTLSVDHENQAYEFIDTKVE